MSIVFSHGSGWILCHSAYLHELYKTLKDEELCRHCGRYELFHISNPFLKIGQKNSVSSLVPPENESASFNSDPKPMVNAFSSEFHQVVNYVKKAFTQLITDAKKFPNLVKKCNLRQSNNELAVKVVNTILENNSIPKSNSFHGENNNSYPIAVTHNGVEYFIPPQCRFYNCPVLEIQNKVANQGIGQFDVILLDPPWWNKHVRRKNGRDPRKGYKMLHDDDLMEIPIDKLLSSDGLVIIWCTNSKQHTSRLINEMFSVWKISYITSWYWVKITDSCSPICEFSTEEGKKQPFERIIFGSRPNRSDKFRNPDPNKLIISIPSAIHSHKPPLTNVLSECIPPGSLCIEMFARYLIPNWTSCGDEVFKLQQKSIFTCSETII